MPSEASVLGILFSIVLIAFIRTSVICAASFLHSSSNLCSFASSSANSSSQLSICPNFSESSAWISSRSSIVVTLCFCSREYILSNVEFTDSRRCGSNSISVALELISCNQKIFKSSIYFYSQLSSYCKSHYFIYWLKLNNIFVV